MEIINIEDPSSILLFYLLSGGQEFFKITLSIVDLDEVEDEKSKKKETKKNMSTPDRYKSTGSKCIFILAAFRKTPENYDNVYLILEQLKIEFIEEITINSDLKLLNIICGCQSPSGSTHPCVYCRGNKIACLIGKGENIV